MSAIDDFLEVMTITNLDKDNKLIQISSVDMMQKLMNILVDLYGDYIDLWYHDIIMNYYKKDFIACNISNLNIHEFNYPMLCKYNKTQDNITYTYYHIYLNYDKYIIDKIVDLSNELNNYLNVIDKITTNFIAIK